MSPTRLRARRTKRQTISVRPLAYDLVYGADTAAMPGHVTLRFSFADTGQVLVDMSLPMEEFLRWAASTATVARSVEADLYPKVPADV